MSAISFAAFWAEMGIGWAMSWAEAHPGPFFVALGVAGAAGVLGIAARILARDDMPLTFAEQAQLDELAAMQRPAELHHEPARAVHAHARHARPGLLRRLAGWWRNRRETPPAPDPGLVATEGWAYGLGHPLAILRAQTWAVASLAARIQALPAAPARLALPAPPAGDGPAPVRAVTTSPGPGSEPSGVTGPAPAPDVPGRAPATSTAPGSSPAAAAPGTAPAGDPRWPWLDRPWADDTGSFAAICREGT